MAIVCRLKHLLILAALFVVSATARVDAGEIIQPIGVTSTIAGDAGSHVDYLLVDNPGFAAAALQRPRVRVCCCRLVRQSPTHWRPFTNEADRHTPSPGRASPVPATRYFPSILARTCRSIQSCSGSMAMARPEILLAISS